MPTYEYKCNDCGHLFEKEQKITAKPIKKCPKCEGTVERLISATAFSLKGGGWYKDGYASTSSHSCSSGCSSCKKTSDKKSEKKS